MKLDLKFLNRTPLFRGIREEDLPGLLNCLHAKVSSYRKQDIILLAGQPVSSVGVVLSGQVQVVREDFMGNRDIVAGLEPGDLFAESYSFVSADSLPVTVVSAADSEVLWVQGGRLASPCSAACRFHSKLIENMLSILASKNIMLNRKIEHLSRRTTREKLLSYLSEQAVRSGGREFDVPFTRQELADYLCVDRSAMSNELSKLRGEGVLQFRRNHFLLNRTQGDHF